VRVPPAAEAASAKMRDAIAIVDFDLALKRMPSSAARCELSDGQSLASHSSEKPCQFRL
jgi:hypothetical protein